MGLGVVFVSGPRRSGKSELIRTMIDRVYDQQPHYIRLTPAGSDKKRPAPSARPAPKCGVASARWLEYDAERIFEVLPSALTAIHRTDRFGSVVIEADTDPALRSAYPYDYRVFVMPMPSGIGDVFRSSHGAAAEFRRVLDDTTAFASEFFGLFEGRGSDDVDPPEDRPDLSVAQMRRFLQSPLGDELASRIQLMAPYHGLVESDVIVINNALGEPGRKSRDCIARIELLLERARAHSHCSTELFHCDPSNLDGEICRKLLNALRPMCVGGT